LKLKILDIFLFLTFGGSLSAVALLTKLQLNEMAGMIIPGSKLLLMLLCFSLFIRKPQVAVYNSVQILLLYFIIFCYSLRILWETITLEILNLSAGVGNFYTYFIFFTLLPIMILSRLEYSKIDPIRIVRVIKYSLSVFCIVAFIIYFENIITGTRLNNRIDNSVINPLALSILSGALLILIVHELIYTKITILNCLILLFPLACLFAGGSRGPIVAIIITVLCISLPAILKDFNIKKLSVFLILLPPLVSITVISVYTRLQQVNIVDDTNSASIRYNLYTSAWDQFLSNPLFGSSLQNEKYGAINHNFILDLLLATGLVPVVLFIFTLFNLYYLYIRYPQTVAFNIFFAMFFYFLICAQFSGAFYRWETVFVLFVLCVNYRKVIINE